MAYQYEPASAEKAAETLLRNRGWRVERPACPDCGGLGSISTVEKTLLTWEGSPTFDMTQKPCPRGCQMPSFYYSTTTAGLGS